MLEQIILGIIQGIAEWLPISSEGMLILAEKNIFHIQQSLETAIGQALFLHLGTFSAALIYFQKEVRELTVALFRFKSQPKDTQNLLIFLLISTLISGLLGWTLIRVVENLTSQFDPHGRPITTLIGFLLLGTGLLELKAKKGGYKELKDLKIIDGILLGIVQGFAALPGLSRSGLTVSALLLRKFDKTYALKLSFLMSLPIVLGGNVFLHFNVLRWSVESLVGLIVSFAFGLLTIHLLLKVAERVNFGYFVLFFGCLTLLATQI